MDYVYKEDLVQRTVTGSTSYTTITSTDKLTSGNKYAIFVNSQFGGNDTSFLFGIRVKSGGDTLLGSTRVREMNSVVHEQSYSYMTMITTTTLFSGLFFELPIIIYLLTKLSIISPALLIKYRKHALVAILVLSAIITPPDIISQVLVSFPILILYEIGIIASKRVAKKRK